MLNLIPIENVLNIYDYLGYTDLNNISYVCKYLNDIKRKFMNIKKIYLEEFFRKHNEILNEIKCKKEYMFNIIRHLNYYNNLQCKDILIEKKKNNNSLLIIIKKDNNKISINFENGKRKLELWKTYGINNNNIGPALITWYDNGSLMKKIYYLNGLAHKEKGAAIIHYYDTGYRKSELNYINGENAIIDKSKPLTIRWHENGIIAHVIYTKQDIGNHLVEKKWDYNGNLIMEINLCNNNIISPGLIIYHNNGRKKKIIYFKNSRSVRTIIYDINGDISFNSNIFTTLKI
mgnify:CR=1 FL=1